MVTAAAAGLADSRTGTSETSLERDVLDAEESESDGNPVAPSDEEVALEERDREDAAMPDDEPGTVRSEELWPGVVEL